ncbi:alpha/beta hydrolase [Saccharopolyspora erythraea]|nr:alpha/beta hydrolase [Saccharopolyspora erythraea]
MVLPGPGPDAPTVVFEAGAAAGRSTWALVQPAVTAWARAVVYDRSGLGRSAADRRSRSLLRMAHDLGAVLDHFGPGPFVLVGDSAGGPIARAAAAASPQRIAGLVLVDPTDEAADVLFGRAFRVAERTAISANLVLARAGLLGLLHRSTIRALPVEARDDLRREGFTAEVVRTQAAQARTFLDELSGFRAHPPEMGDIPVTVISGGLAGGGMGAGLRAAANAAHAERAARSPRGRHVVAERSGHYVPISEPDVVTAEIARLARSTKAGGQVL